MISAKREKRIRRHKKIRMSIAGTKDQPRLYVFRSNAHIYAQLVDDDAQKVLFSVSDKEVKAGKGKKKTEIAKEVGALIAKKAVEKNITKAVFDRGGFLFHGRVKALAEGAREGGLTF